MGGQTENRGEMKSTSFTGLAVHPYLAAHHFNQTLTDGQPQTRSPVFTRGGCVGLGKGLKKFGGLLGSHADTGILYGKGKGYLLIGFINQLRVDHNLPVLRELYRVVGKIEKDLAQTQWVADQGQRHNR